MYPLLEKVRLRRRSDRGPVGCMRGTNRRIQPWPWRKCTRRWRGTSLPPYLRFSLDEARGSIQALRVHALPPSSITVEHFVLSTLLLPLLPGHPFHKDTRECFQVVLVLAGHVPAHLDHAQALVDRCRDRAVGVWQSCHLQWAGDPRK